MFDDSAGILRSERGEDSGYCYMLDEDQILCACSRYRTPLLGLRKTLSAFRFKLCRFLKQYVLYCITVWVGRCERYHGGGSFQRLEGSGIFF